MEAISKAVSQLPKYISCFSVTHEVSYAELRWLSLYSQFTAWQQELRHLSMSSQHSACETFLQTDVCDLPIKTQIARSQQFDNLELSSSIGLLKYILQKILPIRTIIFCIPRSYAKQSSVAKITDFKRKNVFYEDRPQTKVKLNGKINKMLS